MSVDDLYAPAGRVARSKNEIVVDLQRRLMSEEFSVGSKLPSERELGAYYRVSRPVIREALAGLAERGFIEIYAGKGSFVRPAGANDLSEPLVRAVQRGGATARNLIAARLMIEVTAVQETARSADAEALASISTALDHHQRAISTRDQVLTDFDFHESIVRASGNPVIVVMFGSIRDFVHSMMLRSHSDPGVHSVGDPMHQSIYECIAAHDPDGARAIMVEHLELGLSLYGTDLDLPLTDVIQYRGLDAVGLAATD